MDFLNAENRGKNQIIFEVFNLNDLQEEIFNELKDSQLTVKRVAQRVDRDRSTVQRALKDMVEKEILEREGRSDKTVYYVYTTPSMDKLEDLTMNVIQEWYNTVLQKLS